MTGRLRCSHMMRRSLRCGIERPSHDATSLTTRSTVACCRGVPTDLSLDEISVAGSMLSDVLLRHGSSGRQVDLALDLLSSPTGGIDGA